MNNDSLPDKIAQIRIRLAFLEAVIRKSPGNKSIKKLKQDPSVENILKVIYAKEGHKTS